jgi:hypothetical protein
MKTIITIYSTCQGHGIMHYLQKFLNYNCKNNNYRFNIIHNCYLIENPILKDNIIEELKKTDIFIYQKMNKKWGILSTDKTVENSIGSYIPTNCKHIIIPYIYVSWLWSIGKSLIGDTTLKYTNDNIIINLKKNYNLDTILSMYDNNEIDFNYLHRIHNEINILREKEKSADIKISDYILNNYKDKELFYSYNHPTHYIYKEMTKQILNILNIPLKNFDYKFQNDICYIGYDIDYNFRYSTYDKNIHNFKFQYEIDDDYIKKCIKEIYYNF